MARTTAYPRPQKQKHVAKASRKPLRDLPPVALHQSPARKADRGAHKPHGRPLVQRPVRESMLDAQKPPKIQQKMSVAGVFKKYGNRLNSKDGQRQHGKKRRREKTPEFELLIDLQDGLDEARMEIDAKKNKAFEAIHAAFAERLNISRRRDEEFVEEATYTANTLTAPLAQEEIKTVFMRGGKEIEEVSEMGKQVAKFNDIITKEQAKLASLWVGWNRVQNEYIELGIEVFGAEAFNEQAKDFPRRTEGFKSEMELVNLEYETEAAELQDEIEGLGVELFKKMKNSERDLDAAVKKEQTKMLQALL